MLSKFISRSRRQDPLSLAIENTDRLCQASEDLYKRVAGLVVRLRGGVEIMLT
jgi:hypothetical protein